jgi:hypothetical protein
MKNFKVNPIGLKGKQLHERQLQLMGMTPINENTSKSVVELTKIGPDGKTYGIVRENHEYYIKTSDKSSDLVVEDFNYIGGLQNKKQEAYPSYAKAIKQLNFKFKSLSEAYGRGGDINVFVDDNLLSEHHPYSAEQKLSATKGMGDGQEYIVDKAGTPLSNKAKEGKEADGFGDNVADKDVDDEFEKVNIKESGFAGFSSGMGNGFSGAGNLEGNSVLYGDDIEMTEYEMAIDSMRDESVYDSLGEYDETTMQGFVDPETFEKTEGMTSFGDDVELNEFEEAIDNMMTRDEDDYVDYTMGNQEDPNQLPNPPREINIPEEFPDLTGDGEVTKADILKGRGVELEEADDELYGNQDRLDVDSDGEIESSDLRSLRAMEESIKRLDAMITSLSEGTVKKKVLTIKKK